MVSVHTHNDGLVSSTERHGQGQPAFLKYYRIETQNFAQEKQSWSHFFSNFTHLSQLFNNLSWIAFDFRNVPNGLVGIIPGKFAKEASPEKRNVILPKSHLNLLSFDAVLRRNPYAIVNSWTLWLTNGRMVLWTT
jgi:hypothetical protein